MKKVNNIGFILALILCICMLFAYCNKSSAAIFDSDVFEGPAEPDYVQPTPKPNAINTTVYTPWNFGDLLSTNSLQNLNIFSGNMSYETFNLNFNSSRMYYTNSVLKNIEFIYKSYCLVYVPELTDDFEGVVFNVHIKDKFGHSTITNAKLVTYYGDYSTSGRDIYYYKGSNYVKTLLNTDDYTTGTIFLLEVSLPAYMYFNSIDSNYMQNGYYISRIDVQGYNGDYSNADFNHVLIYHLFDYFSINGGFSLPRNTDIFYCFSNNVGYKNSQYDFLKDDIFYIYSSSYIDNQLLQCFSSQSLGSDNYVYTSLNSGNSNVILDYCCFLNSEVADLWASYNYGEYGYTFDKFDKISQGDFSELRYYFGEYPDYLTGYQVNFSFNNEIENKLTSNYPYFSVFGLFALMPAGAETSGSALQFDDINAEKYYIEPNDWKDFGAHFNNIVVWLCFEMPLFSTLTKPIYLFLNGFLEVWVEIALPLATACGLIGGALIFYLIYLFISKLLFNKSPD